MQNAVEISVADISANGHYQGRVATNTEVVDQYREALERGDAFPPVEVYEVDAQLVLVDGFHRYAAHLQSGRTTILAAIRPGSEAQALESALCANQTHGLPRSNADKRLLVERALELEAFQGLSQRELAKKLRVSAPFVGKIHRQAGEAPAGALLNDAKIPPQVKTFTPSDDSTPSQASGFPLEDGLKNPTQDHTDEMDLLREAVAMYEKENENLSDQLAAAMISPSPEDRDSANEYIKEMREKIRVLEIEVHGVKISRDRYMNERSEMLRQVRYWERQAKKYKAQLDALHVA